MTEMNIPMILVGIICGAVLAWFLRYVFEGVWSVR